MINNGENFGVNGVNMAIFGVNIEVKQIRLFELILCGQMYEPSKRKSGCNYRKTVNYS